MKSMSEVTKGVMDGAAMIQLEKGEIEEFVEVHDYYEELSETFLAS